MEEHIHQWTLRGEAKLNFYRYCESCGQIQAKPKDGSSDWYLRATRIPAKGPA